MMTAADAETNILRTTVAGFAAAVGGADSIAILPHTIAHGLPAGFARRVARNTQTIMARESHLDHVADPAFGSGSLEALTEDLCAAAWSEFQRVEAEGGVLSSLRDGHIQKRVMQARARLAGEYGGGRRAILGTTLHPPRQDRNVETLAAETRPGPTDGVVHCQPLAACRVDQFIGKTA
jgi:methylmalonyl-CoA mutase